MKTVIMAGGKGTRISAIASDIPKPMIKINGKPVLEWEIECLKSQGFTDIMITVSYLAEKIMAYFGDGSKWNVHIEYYIEDQPLGNAGAVFKLWQSGKLDRDFLLLIADAVFDVSLNRFIQFHKDHAALATLFTHPNSHPYDSGLVVSDEKSHIVTGWMGKKDTRPVYYKNRVNAGLHILSPEIFELAQTDFFPVGAGRWIDLDRDILKPLVSTSRIYAYDSSEYVKDMGTPERFQAVSDDLASGKVAARNLKNMQKAVFLDYDETLQAMEEFFWTADLSQLCYGAAEAFRMINDSSYLAVMIVNQPNLSGKIMDGRNTVYNVCHKMETLLGSKGAYIDAVYDNRHCSGHAFEQKKEAFLQAVKDFNIDIRSSWVITAGEREARVADKAGCKAVLLKSAAYKRESEQTAAVTDTFFEAVKYILLKQDPFC